MGAARARGGRTMSQPGLAGGAAAGRAAAESTGEGGRDSGVAQAGGAERRRSAQIHTSQHSPYIPHSRHAIQGRPLRPLQRSEAVTVLYIHRSIAHTYFTHRHPANLSAPIHLSGLLIKPQIHTSQHSVIAHTYLTRVIHILPTSLAPSTGGHYDRYSAARQ